jgi:hypothetical protein
MKHAYSALVPHWPPRSSVALGLLLATASAAHAQIQAATFAPVATFSTGANSAPFGIAAADVNSDGKLDLLTVNNGNNTAGVLLGNGNGTFQPAATFGTGGSSSPTNITVADVNGDGQPDLLTANASSNTVGVLLGNGNGTFQAAATFGTGGSRPFGIAVADVNGDGKPDLLTANSNSNTAGVLLGNGNGTFQPAATFDTRTSQLNSDPYSIAVADVNGDGKPDLLTANFNSNTVGVLLGNGNGTFQAVATYITIGSNPYGIAVADVNGDGQPDVATANLSSDNASVLLGNGNGTFGSAATLSTGGSNPFGIAVADVNGDGKPDLLTANNVSNTVGVRLNTTAYVPTTLTSLNPASGPVGTTVTLRGTNLGNATAVSFNGTAAAFTIVDATTLRATVPSGATTGNVTVKTGFITSNGVAFTVTTATTWTGAVSTDWFTAGNWSAGVPTAALDALVPVVSTGRYPLLGTGTASVQTLTLNSGATLSQSGGTLNLTGNLAGSGSFIATGGTVATTGSAPQTLGSNQALSFQNLTIGAAGAVLGASTSFRQVLTLRGDLTTNGQPLTLLSRVTGGVTQDGLVVNDGGVVVGRAMVQRAIDPSVNAGTGYRHYSPPVANTTVTDLAVLGIVNPAYNTAAVPSTVIPFPTIFGYDDSRLSLSNNLSSFDKGYFSPASLSDPLAVGRGYSVNIGSNLLLTFQGTLTNGTVPLALTSTRPSYPADGGWQLLGNPYPAPLDYSLVDPADRPGLEAAIYVYQSTGSYTGRYRSYVNGIGNPVLPVGQGFFARVATGLSTATITFRNSQRLTTPNPTPFQRTAADSRPLVQLQLEGTGSLDEATVYFEAGATTGFEPAFDAEKLANPSGLNLSTTQSSRQLSIDGQPELGTSQRVVPLAVGVPAVGVYTFTARQLLNLGTTSVYLRDRQLGTLMDLRQQPTYQFTISSAATLTTSRFELVFAPQQVLATVPTALAQQVAVYPNPAQTQVTIELPLSLSRQPVRAVLLDALGRVVGGQQLPAGLATHSVPLATLMPGVYSLCLTTEQGTITKKLIVD